MGRAARAKPRLSRGHSEQGRQLCWGGGGVASEEGRADLAVDHHDVSEIYSF